MEGTEVKLPELPEPIDFCRDQEDHLFDTYTADQMREYGVLCARWAREEAAKTAESDEFYGSAVQHLIAAAIRKE